MTDAGTGFWWEDNTIPAGNKIDLGSVTYGPIKLKKDPYEVTTTTDSQRQRKQTETITTETSTIQPEYLDIQAGANAWQNIPIRLYDLSTVKLKENVGDTDPVSAFHAADYYVRNGVVDFGAASGAYSSSSYDYSYDNDDQNSYTVYITKTGSKYHRAGCRYLRSSKIAIDVDDAIAQGYDACSVCNP